MIKTLKYLFPIVLYALGFVTFTQHGWACWLGIIFGWILIPIIEFILPPNVANLTSQEEALAKQNHFYDFILYFIVATQFVTLFFFLQSMQQSNVSIADTLARIVGMGFLCGVFGINVGHELGHRKNKWEQALAKASLLTSLYIHFFIEHNKGHHKNVATKEDPSSARKNEIIYLFYFRTIIYTYINAWKIAITSCKQHQKSIFSIHNQMLLTQLIQLCFIGLIYFLFGGIISLYFLVAAAIGILLLETVNYIQHYGLTRNEITPGKYERTLAHHSWNSNHVIGRIMLFELSRHSDHHYTASKKYQTLQHHEIAPQMPTGYPAMMLLSLIPPLWFYVMNHQLKKLQLNQVSN